MRGFGEGADVMQVVFDPGSVKELRIGEFDATGFPERRHSLSTGKLAAFWIDGDDSANFLLQLTDDGGAVGFVFNQDGVRAGKFCVTSLDGSHGGAEVKAIIGA